MDSSWDRMKRQLEDFYQAASEKTDELARVGARKIDVMTLRRQLSRELAALGGRVYELVRKAGSASIAGDDEVARRVETAAGLEAEIARREAEIEEIRRTAADRRATKQGGARDPGDATGPEGVPG